VAEGLVRYPSDGQVALTDAGRARAHTPARPSTQDELHERIFRLLGGDTAKILRPLVKCYPEPMDRAELASDAGYTNVTSKGFALPLRRLASFGIYRVPVRWAGRGWTGAVLVVFGTDIKELHGAVLQVNT